MKKILSFMVVSFLAFPTFAMIKETINVPTADNFFNYSREMKASLEADEVKYDKTSGFVLYANPRLVFKEDVNGQRVFHLNGGNITYGALCNRLGYSRWDMKNGKVTKSDEKTVKLENAPFGSGHFEFTPESWDKTIIEVLGCSD